MIDTSVPLEKINEISRNNMLSHLGIEIIGLGQDYLIGSMPVDHRTQQPMGLLHGGATATLIETLGSLGSSLLVDLSKFNVVGIEINVNHIRGVKSGFVSAKAVILHEGRKTHIWQVDVKDDTQKLIATGRLTVMVIDKK